MGGHQFGYKQKFLKYIYIFNYSSLTASPLTWQLRGLFTNYECTQSHVLLSPCPEGQPLRLHVNGKNLAHHREKGIRGAYMAWPGLESLFCLATEIQPRMQRCSFVSGLFLYCGNSDQTLW
jgi:hypothetical protein